MRLIEILSRLSSIPTDKIQPQSDLFEDLSIDSIELVESFYEVEKSFGISLDPAIITKQMMNTPEKFLHLILEKKRTQNSP